jgi:hypothetical protein
MTDQPQVEEKTAPLPEGVSSTSFLLGSFPKTASDVT